MSRQTLSKYESDCLQDFGYLPDLEEPDAELESLAATPEGMGLEKSEPEEGIPFSLRLGEVLREMHQAERAKVERMRCAA